METGLGRITTRAGNAITMIFAIGNSSPEDLNVQQVGCSVSIVFAELVGGPSYNVDTPRPRLASNRQTHELENLRQLCPRGASNHSTDLMLACYCADPLRSPEI